MAMRRQLRRTGGAIAAGVVLATVAGCASTPPYHALNHERVVPLAAADVWRRLHAFLQDQGIPVVSEDLKAGVIDAARTSPGKGLLASYADCGSSVVQIIRPLERETLALTVLVRPAADGARVTANAAFSRTLRARGAGAVTVACTSRGVLEAAVLNVASGQPMEAAVVPQ